MWQMSIQVRGGSFSVPDSVSPFPASILPRQAPPRDSGVPVPTSLGDNETDKEEKIKIPSH